ncbi:MAG: glycosyltransferase [Candidatus Faecousia sp.]|nr:glycosyltransferase [Candidatus Faecousia sp.]
MAVTLSIIIPAYNAVSYLEDCIESVMSGTYQDFEILLIDDGSVDGTGSLCDRLAEKYSVIQVFHTPNRGLSNARNLGIDHASGQYIGFVDADDVIAPNMFEALVHCMEPDVDMTACRFQRCKREALEVTVPSITCQTITNQAETAQKILTGGYGPNIWNKLFKAEVLNQNEIRFRKGCRAMEDMYFTTEYLIYCRKAVFLDAQLYYYITTDGSITSTFRDNRVVGSVYVDLPRSWRFCTEVVEPFSHELGTQSRARTVMFYQTVLRKLENPDNQYIKETVAYVKKNKTALLHYKWGLKYYLSAIVLSISYPLWAKIFRRGLPV